MVIITKKSDDTLHIRALLGPESDVQRSIGGLISSDITELLKIQHENVILSVDNCKSEIFLENILGAVQGNSTVDATETEKDSSNERKCLLCGGSKECPIPSLPVCYECTGLELKRLLNKRKIDGSNA